MSNPFFYGNPVPSDQLVDRRREIRRIVGRIINQGQSTAIVGEPRSGKTSLLLYLAAPEKREELYGEEGKRLLFSFLDAQTFGGQFSQAQFWEQALRPLHEQAIAPKPDSLLAQAYKMCQDNKFGAFVLERLFTQVGEDSWRLVLLLDEFNDLLYHPILNSAEFFGSLRSLASRSRGALALIIATRHSLTNLNEATQQFSRGGSPYFNFLDEVTLGSLPEKAVAELLGRAGSRFTADDRRFIAWVAGRHPDLLQAAASALWEAYDEDYDPLQRWQQASQSLYDEAARTLGDTWRLWAPETRKAFTIVALAHVNSLEQYRSLLKQSKFDVKRLIRDLPTLESELRLLGRLGFIAEDANIPGGWRVRPGVFLWWLTDELVKTARHETKFEEWWQAQQMEGLLTRGEKQKLGEAAKAITGALRDSAVTFVQAAAKAAAETIVKGK
jgi:hypothetical protein